MHTLPLGGFVNQRVHSFIKGCLTLKLFGSWKTVTSDPFEVLAATPSVPEFSAVTVFSGPFSVAAVAIFRWLLCSDTGKRSDYSMRYVELMRYRPWRQLEGKRERRTRSRCVSWGFDVGASSSEVRGDLVKGREGPMSGWEKTSGKGDQAEVNRKTLCSRQNLKVKCFKSCEVAKILFFFALLTIFCTFYFFRRCAWRWVCAVWTSFFSHQKKEPQTHIAALQFGLFALYE